MFDVSLQVPPLSLLLHTDESVGLGSPPSRSDGFGGVVLGGVISTHQHAGSESCCSGSGSLSAPVVRPECHPDERQRLGCRLPPESRRPNVSCPVSHGCRGSSLDRAPFALPDGQVYSGKKNVLADQLSHPDQVLPTEWSLLSFVAYRFMVSRLPVFL